MNVGWATQDKHPGSWLVVPTSGPTSDSTSGHSSGRLAALYADTERPPFAYLYLGPVSGRGRRETQVHIPFHVDMLAPLVNFY